MAIIQKNTIYSASGATVQIFSVVLDGSNTVTRVNHCQLKQTASGARREPVLYLGTPRAAPAQGLFLQTVSILRRSLSPPTAYRNFKERVLHLGQTAIEA